MPFFYQIPSALILKNLRGFCRRLISNKENCGYYIALAKFDSFCARRSYSSNTSSSDLPSSIALTFFIAMSVRFSLLGISFVTSAIMPYMALCLFY